MTFEPLKILHYNQILWTIINHSYLDVFLPLGLQFLGPLLLFLLVQALPSCLRIRSLKKDK